MEHVSTLDYASPPHRSDRFHDPAKRRMGIASCTCWGVSISLVGASFFGSTLSRMDGDWIAAGLLIAWITSTAGAMGRSAPRLILIQDLLVIAWTRRTCSPGLKWKKTATKTDVPSPSSHQNS